MIRQGLITLVRSMRMSFIETTPPDEASGDVLAMYQRQESAWGYVPNYARVFSHRPEVLARWGRFLAEIRRPMSDRCFELVTFAAAIELRNTPCSLAHGRRLTEFFTEAEVCGIAAGSFSASLTDAEQAMVTFARKGGPRCLEHHPEDVAVLKAHGFTDAGIFDIAATAAGRSFFTKLLDALGVQPDASVMKIDRSFREPLTVGRPIA
jgi:uncharacterized peroxidase-related enzyme